LPITEFEYGGRADARRRPPMGANRHEVVISEPRTALDHHRVCDARVLKTLFMSNSMCLRARAIEQSGTRRSLHDLRTFL
jgi:hypothetical protein